MSFNYNEMYDLLSKLNQGKHNRRNKLSKLYLELAYNYDLLRSCSFPPKNDLPKLPILNTGENEIKLLSDKESKKLVLHTILNQLRTDSFQYWISSSHNLNRFGLIQPEKSKPILFWIFLSRLMNRIAVISACLDIGLENKKLEDHFVKVNADLHLKRLREDMGKALSYLHAYRESNWIGRTYKSICKKPLVNKNKVTKK